MVNEETKLEKQPGDAALEGEVGDISADEVTILSGTTKTVEAQTVTVEQGGVQEIRADTVEVHQGGIGKAEATSVRVDQGGVGLAKAETVTISDGGVFGVYANEAHLERSNVVLLAAKKVDGEARILLDWRSAAALGVAVGLALGFLRLLMGRDQ